MSLKSKKRFSKYFLDLLLLTFWICSVFFALSLFLHGFFPIKNMSEDFAVKQDIPSRILNYSVVNHDLYPRHVGRLVFVLIDAFRWDFLDFPQHMPYIEELRRSKKASVLTARCHPPTATMPRIKALMTGSIPNYIDVVLNLGSDQVIEDNLIHQAVQNGQKVVFYGDEVWLNLFPHKFMRKEGTTSFFVSDYTEVDYNVSRHISGEMRKTDWDVLILHYLGLDHIGHLAGPRSPLIPAKLKEMDTVIKNIHESLQQWDSKNQGDPSLLVVVGDHGMHDSGSHGGATLGEILTSLIFIGNISHNALASETRPEVEQIDLSATLAVLLGLPIPKLSLGVLIPYALGGLTHEEYLFALFYNAQQVATQFLQAYSDGSSNECFKMYEQAQNLHLSWMNNRSEALRLHAETLYFHATRDMSSHIVRTLVTFDVWALVIGCFILIQVLFCSLITLSLKKTEIVLTIRLNFFVLYFSGLAILMTSLLFKRIFPFLFPSDTKTFFLMPFGIFLIILHCWVVFHCCCSLQSSVYLLILKIMRYTKLFSPSVFLRFGCVLHVISLCASSLIEEEHQTWYFMWCTLMVLLLISISRSSVVQPYSLQLKVVGVLLAHRLLRKFNQTGDKWASLPDISDWLEVSENHFFMSIVALTGLIGVWLCLEWLKYIHNTVIKVFNFIAVICVLLYRAAIGEIFLPFISEVSRGLKEVKVFWLAWILSIIFSLRNMKGRSSHDVLQVLVSAWILGCTMLLRPCNIVFIPYLVFSSHVIVEIFKQPLDCSIAHVWLGLTVYYYQGNSNSLSTIDVAAGYIGMEHVNMLLASILVVMHTFSFPVLAALLLWLSSAKQVDALERNRNISLTIHTCFLLRLLPLTIYCILIAIQRYHLFIWSVFAPKLLYEVAHSTVHLVLIGVCSLCLIVCNY